MRGTRRRRNITGHRSESEIIILSRSLQIQKLTEVRLDRRGEEVVFERGLLGDGRHLSPTAAAATRRAQGLHV